MRKSNLSSISSPKRKMEAESFNSFLNGETAKSKSRYIVQQEKIGKIS
jgi:hypothetical protein